MIILGIDPGYAIVGWGVIEYNGSKFRTLGYGSIQTPAGMPTVDRLERIYLGMNELIEKVKEHNFVPVVDDRGCFVGIILRRDILNYLLKFYNENDGGSR